MSASAKRVLTSLVLAALLVCRSPVRAQAPADVLAAAKKEGSVVWYTTIQTTTINAIVKRFEQIYPGITLEPLRLGSTQLPPRIITEEHGGKYNVDVIQGDDFQFAQLLDAGVLQRYPNPEASQFIKGTVDPNGMWTNMVANTTVIAYNPQRLKTDGLKPPASVADLAQPQWKGRVGIDAGAFNWYIGMLQTRPSGTDELFRSLAAGQPVIVGGHTEAARRLETGEYDASPTVYGYLAERDKERGRPIDFVNPRPLLVTLNPVGLAKNAPHPNAARLLIDWLTSREGQTFIQSVGGELSSRLDVPAPPQLWDRTKPFVIVRPPDPARYGRVVQQYKTIFGIAS